MKLKIVSILFLMIASLNALSREIYIPDVDQNEFEIIDGIIDHLIPAAPIYPGTHNIAEFTSNASRSQSYSWALYKNDESNKFMLQSWELEKAKDSPQSIANKLEIEIPREAAQLIYTIWSNSILNARYTRMLHRGLDGKTYNFSISLRGIGQVSGEIWSPSENLPPKWLVDTGDLIYKASRSHEKFTQKTLASLKATNIKLTEYSSKSQAGL
ncbi:MAG: hypothetical protein U5M72_12020 [Pseudomonas sp.]|nr:hypothetical protein [Pseudomonas sp.]